MSGWYKLHRGWMDHPALGGKRESYCKRAAWVWMIDAACYRDARVDIAGKTVTLRRGQFSHSLRFLADAWHWSLGAVQRFIDRLKTDSLISTDIDSGRLIVSLCNYEKYQSPADDIDTPSDRPHDTRSIRNRFTSDSNKKERKNQRKKETNDSISRSPVSSEPDPDSDSVKAELIAEQHITAEEQTDNMQARLFDLPPAPTRQSIVPAVIPTKSPMTSKPSDAEVEAAFEAWWSEYPRKLGKGQARKAYAVALTKASHGEMLTGVRRFAEHHRVRGTDQQYIPHGSTYLAGERWLDELPAGPEPKKSAGGFSLSRIMLDMAEEPAVDDSRMSDQCEPAALSRAQPAGPVAVDADFEVIS